MKRMSLPLILFAVTSFSLGMFAQESAVKGSLGGVVLDQSGAVVSESTVTLNGPTGTRTTATDSEGRFNFSLLTPGLYAVSAQKTGFKVVQTKDVEVFTNKTSSVRLTLLPGAISETVEVTASTVTVDTSSSAVSTNLNDNFYQNLPVARNVTGLFYASAGVTSGGATGSANPSISGGSGLENQYVADGVNITDGAFGGIGVYSRNYGPLATGINLSFVKEVEVKTGGYEPQYGKSTGGVVQIVTKSGTNEYHGALAGYYGPQQFGVTHLNPDDSGRLNQQGFVENLGAWDISAEIGGPVPRFKDNLFFFGSFNPSWTRYYDRFAPIHGVEPFTLPTSAPIKQLSYDYAAKLTWKLNSKNTVETSIFGDPTRENNAPNAFTDPLVALNTTHFSSLSNGTRNWVARYNATISPTWLFNFSFSWGHNYLNETPGSPNVYQVVDDTGVGDGTSALGPDGTPLPGEFLRQGLGYYENTQGDNYALNFDTEKVVNKFGNHTFSIGYRYERNSYSGSKLRTGPRFPIPPNLAANSGLPSGLMDDAAFTLLSSTTLAEFQISSGVVLNVPGYSTPQEVALEQSRGTFSDPNFDTHGRYHAAYANDSWAINKHITVNVGWRWEQQTLEGAPFNLGPGTPTMQSHYTFTDNWSPRIGLAIDPLGDRKTKIYGNFARYNYGIPLDLAIRSLSNEQDAFFAFWQPPFTNPNPGQPCDVNLNPCPILTNPDGSITPVLDDAHTLNAFGTANPIFFATSFQSGEAIAHGTKMEYLDEYVGGIEHEFKHGIVASARYQQRKLKRIVEDMSGISPEASDAGITQQFLIGNPGSATDLFTNPQEVLFPVGGPVPAACVGHATATSVPDASGNDLGGVCIPNDAVAGNVGADGIPDGFVDPVRLYKAVEVEIAKGFSSGWQWRTNYRWATLAGNYEGAFRNDNQQSDPSISSLFDFTPGQYGLLGNQFGVGFLNTDRRHILNNFISYTFSRTFMKNLTIGLGARITTGAPVNDLRAHPVYQNAGEIPQGGRGSLGRTPASGQGDVHLDYVMKIGEKSRVHFVSDLFNITNQKTQLRIDQFQDASFGVPNFDFLHPVGHGNIGNEPGYQRPFFARLAVKWEF